MLMAAWKSILALGVALDVVVVLAAIVWVWGKIKAWRESRCTGSKQES